MTLGATGWDVAALQFLLQTRGFGPGGVDGGFGSGTSTAVQGFQSAVGLGADGVAGPLTLRALEGGQVTTATPTDGVSFVRPLPGPWTDGFGWVGGRRHTGLDFPAAAGTPVHAAGVGTVSYAGYNTGGYGNLVVVTHRLGFETWYAHLSSVAVGAGAVVNSGTILGAVGATGHATGPHLHFEVRQYGTPIDPAPRLGATLALRARAPARTTRCAPNADVRHPHDTDPPFARLDRCP
jgi:murein DD-endopeptidase MepM/ murein hydrolase activator NlpD